MEKLDSKSLMVGDWVLINGTPRKIQAVDGDDDEIMAGDELYTLVEDRYHSEDRVEPIPLTSEILEKNGFERFGTDYVLKGEHFGLDNPSTPNHYLDNYWLRISIRSVHIRYIHELQHALKLCGINKTIEL